MRTPKGEIYLSSPKALDQYKKGLKQRLCPFCRLVGFLNAHSKLYGHDWQAKEANLTLLRGQRMFCCNRNGRGGCGRSYAVVLSGHIWGHCVSAPILWGFLWLVRRGWSRLAAWQQVAGMFSVQTGYRLWAEIRIQQPHLRTALCRECPPPACDSAVPIMELIDHLQAAFAGEACPVSRFQERFQSHFFG